MKSEAGIRSRIRPNPRAIRRVRSMSAAILLAPEGGAGVYVGFNSHTDSFRAEFARRAFTRGALRYL